MLQCHDPNLPQQFVWTLDIDPSCTKVLVPSQERVLLRCIHLARLSPANTARLELPSASMIDSTTVGMKVSLCNVLMRHSNG